MNKYFVCLLGGFVAVKALSCFDAYCYARKMAQINAAQEGAE